jgi:hypothetical protein
MAIGEDELGSVRKVVPELLFSAQHTCLQILVQVPDLKEK